MHTYVRHVCTIHVQCTHVCAILCYVGKQTDLVSLQNGLASGDSPFQTRTVAIVL